MTFRSAALVSTALLLSACATADTSPRKPGEVLQSGGTYDYSTEGTVVRKSAKMERDIRTSPARITDAALVSYVEGLTAEIPQ